MSRSRPRDLRRGAIGRGTTWQTGRAISAHILSGVAGLAAPESARAAATALFATQPQRPTISVGAELFPETVPGYNQELGLTLPAVSLNGPAAEGQGLRLGKGLVMPSLEADYSYDSNVLGVRHGPGSVILRTSPAVSFDDSGSRARVGAYAGLDNSEYFQTPTQSHTDFKAALGAAVAVGRGDVTVAYSHLSLHDDPTLVGSIPSSTPTPFTLDDLRASFEIAIGRAALRPFIETSYWSYSSATIGGVPSSQRYRDRLVGQAGIAGRYTLGEGRDLLTTFSVDRNEYFTAISGQPLPSSTDAEFLAGLDYQLNGALRFRVLAGLQTRAFDNHAFQTRTEPVGQATVTWIPQRMTTVALAVSRSLEDLAQEDTGGTVFSRAEIDLTHELKRNVVLREQIGVSTAQFLQLGGTQAQVFGKTGFEWTINRFVKMLGDLQVQRESTPVGVALAGPANGPYTRVTAHLGVTVAI